MKKIISLLVMIIVAFCGVYNACGEVIMISEYTITEDGEITAYYGDEWVVVPQSVDGIPVTKIGEMAFFDIGISDVYLPEGLSVIGKSAFEGCNVISVDIPSTVSIIGKKAFENCAELYTVYINFDENTVIGENAFSGTGHILFYLNCNSDTKAIERKLLEAKGNSDFEVEVRHVASEYDKDGNVICKACGFREQYLPAELPFEDVPDDAWYYKALQIAYINNIIGGKSETVFDPFAGMTCAEAVKIAACVHRIFNDTEIEDSEDIWYQPYVDYCYKYGLIEDYIVFDWEKNITRAQMAYIFSHCDPFEEWYEDINDVPITDIPDVYDTTPFAYEILTLYNKGIAAGDDKMNFYPDSDIKRCEAAAIVSRIIDWKERIELPKG